VTVYYGITVTTDPLSLVVPFHVPGPVGGANI